MHNILIPLFSALLAGFQSRLSLQTEILTLRHQIIVLGPVSLGLALTFLARLALGSRHC
jgi:hypothetical protein